MRFLVTGASGLVGSALIPQLRLRGHQVLRLVRKQPATESDAGYWDPESGTLDGGLLEGIEVVVHLAGENIAASRWTPERKRRILDSRVKGTRLLAERLAALQTPPPTVIDASAIGFYGNRGDEVLTEDSGPGSGFLAEVCKEWERAASVAEVLCRLVRLRIGMILTTRGGALARMLPPFRAGVGGRLGSGRQFMSWIALDDLIEVILFAAANPTLRGPVNAVAPHPVTNAEFTGALGRALHRPTLFSVPAFAVRILFGEMGEELLLSSSRVVPQRLQAAGFQFGSPTVESALSACK